MRERPKDHEWLVARRHHATQRRRDRFGWMLQRGDTRRSHGDSPPRVSISETHGSLSPMQRQAGRARDFWAARRPVRSSTSGRPIVLLLDLLGRRWTLRVLWELRRPASSFRELQARCDGMSSSVLWKRVGELREAGIVTGAADEPGLRLTAEGEDLLDRLLSLNDWAERRAAQTRETP